MCVEKRFSKHFHLCFAYFVVAIVVVVDTTINGLK